MIRRCTYSVRRQITDQIGVQVISPVTSGNFLYRQDWARYVLTSSNTLSHGPQEEVNTWFTLHRTSLPHIYEEILYFVKHITGCMPLLLRSLPRFKDKPFNEATFLLSQELVDDQEDINDFYDRALENVTAENRERFAVSSNARTRFNCHADAKV